MGKEWALPEINLKRCIHCGDCAAGCPEQAIEMQQQGPAIPDPQNCTYCTECEALCPHGAISCPFIITWAA